MLRARHITWLALTGPLVALAVSAFVGAVDDGSGQEGRVVLRVVNWASQVEADWENLNLAEFNAEHPGIHAILDPLPHGAYNDKIIAAHAAGKMPDLLLLDHSVITPFAGHGMLHDLMTFQSRDPEPILLDDFYDLPLEMFRRDSRLYAIPKDFTPLVVYYNKRMFKELGVREPSIDNWTWEEFRQTAIRLTRDMNGDGRPDRYGLILDPSPVFWMPFVWQAGGAVCSPDGKRVLGFLNGDAAMKALRFYTNLQLKDGVAPSAVRQEVLGGDLFQTGKIGMMISGHWMIPLLLAAKSPNFNLDTIGIIGLPYPEPKKRANIILAAGWAIPARSKHPEESWQLLKWMVGRRAMQRRAKGMVAIMGRRSVAERMRDNNAFEPVFLDELQTIRVPEVIYGERWSFFERSCRQALEAVLIGAVELEPAFRRAARRIEEDAAW